MSFHQVHPNFPFFPRDVPVVRVRSIWILLDLALLFPMPSSFSLLASFPAGAVSLRPLGGVLGRLPCKVGCPGINQHIVLWLKRAGEMEFGDVHRCIDYFYKA